MLQVQHEDWKLRIRWKQSGRQPSGSHPPFAIRHGQVFNLTADVWVLKKLIWNTLVFVIFHDRFCNSKPKVCRFGIEKARLWRVMREAEPAEVGLVRGVQFRFERNWGEDRSIDFSNELQSKCYIHST